MKTKIYFLLTFLSISISGFCQIPNPDNPFEKQITYSPLNDADVSVQLFIQEKMAMHVISYTPSEKGKVITVKYGQNAFMGKDQNLIFRYVLFIDSSKKSTGKSAIIKSLDITGSASKVMYFFATYWTTNLNENDKELFSYYWQDKARFYYDNAGNPKITVTNTTIKNEADYFIKMKSSAFVDSLTIATTNKGKLEQQKRGKIEQERKVAYMKLRDSLINVATSYHIPFTITNDLNPSNDWFFYVIDNYKKRYSAGKYDNSGANVDAVKAILEKAKLKLDINNPYGDDFVISIDKDGVIYEVKYLLTDPKIAKISSLLKGQKVIPFKAPDNNYYPSFAKLSIMVWNTVQVSKTSNNF